MAKERKDLAASVRQRLLNLAREEERVFEVVLVAFGLERLIYRLSISEYRNDFVLKGGMLVTLWTADPGRFTRDVDFLAFGSEDEGKLKSVIAEILMVDGGDGLVFDAANISSVPIREDQVYGGVRLKTTAYLGKTKIPITIDIGFGDALGDPKHEVDYGSLLDLPAGNIRAYSPATVIAEKLHAVVSLGIANGRMKDFYDLWAVPKAVEIDDDELANTIRATFQRREMKIPDECPIGLSSDFSNDVEKIIQWNAYAQSTELEGVTLGQITKEIWDRLGGACVKAANIDKNS